MPTTGMSVAETSLEQTNAGRVAPSLQSEQSASNSLGPADDATETVDATTARPNGSHQKIFELQASAKLTLRYVAFSSIAFTESASHRNFVARRWTTSNPEGTATEFQAHWKEVQGRLKEKRVRHYLYRVRRRANEIPLDCRLLRQKLGSW